MKTPFFLKKRLDNSAGIGQDNSNEAMNATEQSKKMPWHLRFARDLNLKEIATTAGIGTIYGLLFASLLFAPLLPHLAAQSSGTPTITSSTAQLQDGAQPQWLWTILPVLGGTGLRIAWRKWVLGAGGAVATGYAGTALWDATTKTWTLPPGATRKGKIRAMGDIWLSKVDGKRTHWYSKSGDWAFTTVWRYDLNGVPIHNTPVESANRIRDYHYYDYSCSLMVWDEDNEIWRTTSDSSSGLHKHIYGNTGYDPDLINSFRNDGEPGAHYPDHEDYKKGKEGWFIWYGDNVKNYLSHEFKSTVSGEDKYADLAAEAKKENKDKFNPVAIVTVSDMTYTANGWKYERRAPSDAHVVTRELSAVENDAETLNDKEYIPLNARHEETKYNFDNCVTYWKAETDWKTGDFQPEGSNIIYTNQRMPYRKYVPEQYITSTDPVVTN